MGRKYSDVQDSYDVTIPVRGEGWSGGPEIPIKGSQDQSNNPNRASLDDIWDDSHIPGPGPVIQ